MKGLISKYVSYTTQFKKKTTTLKMGRRPVYISQTHTGMANRHMKRLSTLLIIIDIKTGARYHITPVRWLSSKNTANVGEAVEKREPSYILV